MSILWNLFSSIVKMVLVFLKTLVAGVTNIVANPVTLVATLTALAVVFTIGLRVGVVLDGKMAAYVAKDAKQKIDGIKLQLDQAVANNQKLASDAAAKVTPIEKEERKAACKADQACRDRKGVK